MAAALTSLKLDPRTKHFAQAVARASGMTFGELVETLLDRYLADATLSEHGQQKAVSDLMNEAWSEHEADQIALLGSRFPETLTERDRALWQGIICESPRYWYVPLTGKPISVSDETFNFALFREELWLFDAVTRSEMIAQANAMRRQRESTRIAEKGTTE